MPRQEQKVSASCIFQLISYKKLLLLFFIYIIQLFFSEIIQAEKRVQDQASHDSKVFYYPFGWDFSLKI